MFRCWRCCRWPSASKDVLCRLSGVFIYACPKGYHSVTVGKRIKNCTLYGTQRHAPNLGLDMTRLSLGWFADMFYFVFAGSALSVSPVIHLITVKVMIIFPCLSGVFEISVATASSFIIESGPPFIPRKKAAAGLRSAVARESLELWQQISLTWIWLTKRWWLDIPQHPDFVFCSSILYFLWLTRRS